MKILLRKVKKVRFACVVSLALSVIEKPSGAIPIGLDQFTYSLSYTYIFQRPT